MKTEFVEVYNELFDGGYARLLRLHQLKLRAIDACERQTFKNVSIRATIN